MQVIPGSHRSGLLKHRKHVSESVLALELEGGTFSADDAVSLNLVAGQTSLHHDNIVHGSPANASNQPRVGLTVRFPAPRYGATWAGHHRPGLSPAWPGPRYQPSGGNTQAGHLAASPRRCTSAASTRMANADAVPSRYST